jgi:toxin-antitoxin system PIN domain toxin
MSFALDANLLVYASAEAAPQHAAANAFLRDCVRGPEVFYVAWPTLMAYLRLVTHPKILRAPLTARQAEQNIDALLAVPHCRTLSEQEGFWSVYRECTKGLAVRGNAVPDAYLAALLKQNGVTRLYTADRDFRRFDFLKVIDPTG